MTTSNTRELRESESEWGAYYTDVARRDLSRRKVLTAGAALSLLASGGLGALLGACGDDDGATATPAAGTPAAGGAATAAPTTFAGVTGDWDTTGTPPYKNGLADAKANPPAEWKQYPWYYKYGPWRYNWDIPVYRGGQIKVPIAPPANYDVMGGAGILASMVYNKMFNPALREGVDLTKATLEPELAIGQEHSPDYTSWTFKIPQNAVFHNVAPVNGRKLTAADVVFSFEQIMQSSVSKTSLKNVTKVSAPDDYTVKFDLKNPQLTLPNTLASENFLIFPKEHYQNQDAFKKTPIGTGPFSLGFWAFQDHADYVRNPKYWELMPIKQEKYGKAPLPLVDTYTNQYFPSNVATNEALINGKIDQFAPGGGLDPTLVKDQLSRIPNAIMITNPYWSCCPRTFVFQYKNPLFQDIRVRKALSMGINRQAIWEQAMQKTGTPGVSPIPWDLSGYTTPPDIKTFGPNVQYDPEKAKALLKEAGQSLPLKFSIYQGPPSINSLWQAQVDQALFQWKKDGIADVTTVVRDGLVLSQDNLNKSFPDMILGSLTRGTTIDTMVTPTFYSGSPGNFGSLSDPKLDDLLDKWAVATDPAEAIRLARAMNQQMIDNVDHLAYGWWGGMEVDNPWMHGTVMSPHAQPNGIALQSRKYIWIDDTAPDGRGGKKVT